MVSAGYDAALGCPEVKTDFYNIATRYYSVKTQGEMEVTPACYSHFTSSLMGLAGGKIAVFLEVEWLFHSFGCFTYSAFIILSY